MMTKIERHTLLVALRNEEKVRSQMIDTMAELEDKIVELESELHITMQYNHILLTKLVKKGE
jgi:hypothetical protein